MLHRSLHIVLVVIALLVPIGSLRADDEPSKPTAQSWRDVEGWRVRVDDRLLDGKDEALGNEALQLLEDRLRDIKRQVQPNRIESLQRVVILLDLSHGGLTSMQYHPSADWLRGNGYSADLEKCVHIPVAAAFVDPRHQQVQPWSVLHELAHAYHDQVLDFDNQQIRDLWKEYRDSKAGDEVLHIDGHTTQHYALTDHKEFFAEMSEAYVGQNDFYPFNRGELKQALPDVYDMMREFWGPLRTSRDEQR